MRFGSILTTAVLIAGAGAAYWYLFTTGAQSPKAPTTRAEGRRAAKRDSGPVPVTVEVVKQETVPVSGTASATCRPCSPSPYGHRWMDG